DLVVAALLAEHAHVAAAVSDGDMAPGLALSAAPVVVQAVADQRTALTVDLRAPGEARALLARVVGAPQRVDHGGALRDARGPEEGGEAGGGGIVHRVRFDAVV